MLRVQKLLVGVSVAWSAAVMAFNDQVCPLPLVSAPKLPELLNSNLKPLVP